MLTHFKSHADTQSALLHSNSVAALHGASWIDATEHFRHTEKRLKSSHTVDIYMQMPAWPYYQTTNYSKTTAQGSIITISRFR